MGFYKNFFIASGLIQSAGYRPKGTFVQAAYRRAAPIHVTGVVTIKQ